jgi:hypothetical protein
VEALMRAVIDAFEEYAKGINKNISKELLAKVSAIRSFQAGRYGGIAFLLQDRR